MKNRKSNSKPVKEFVVDVEKWGNGKLLDKKTGKMCCLGFCALQLGATESEIIGQPYSPISGRPCSLFKPDGLIWTKCAFSFDFRHSVLASLAAGINDSERKPLTKARDLRRLFKKYGLTLRFINTKSLYK